MKKPAKITIWLNLFFLVLFISLMIYLTVKFAPYYTHLFTKPDRFRNFLASYGPISIPVFIFFQIIQVVLAAIPGELLQLAGGYVYGTFFGTLYSTVGILLGSISAFYISRFLGFSLVKNFVSQKNLEKLTFLINSPKSEIMMFLLLLIPGFPKDTLVYLAGFTPIKSRLFFAISTIARLPGILVSSYMGANIQERDYLPVIIISVIACLLSIIGLVKKEVIINKLSKILHHKLSPEKD